MVKPNWSFLAKTIEFPFALFQSYFFVKENDVLLSLVRVLEQNVTHTRGLNVYIPMGCKETRYTSYYII
jgi:hypothetical protein